MLVWVPALYVDTAARTLRRWAEKMRTHNPGPNPGPFLLPVQNFRKVSKIEKDDKENSKIITNQTN